MSKEVTVFKEDLNKVADYIGAILLEKLDTNKIVEEISLKLDVAEDVVFNVVSDVQSRFVSNNAYSAERSEVRKELIEIEELAFKMFNDEYEREVEMLILVYDMIFGSAMTKYLEGVK